MTETRERGGIKFYHKNYFFYLKYFFSLQSKMKTKSLKKLDVFYYSNADILYLVINSKYLNFVKMHVSHP